MTPTPSPVSTRRQLLASAAAAGTALMLPGAARGQQPGAGRPVAARIAHLTDIHLKPTEISEAGTRAALRHAHALDPAPDIILNGGDLIMDALGAPHDKTAAQWDLWRKVAAEEVRLPMLHVIGNHDIFGWQREKAGTTGEEPDYGKAWALRELGLDSPYHAHELNGWKLIILDSVQERGGGAYKPMLDDPQFAWLEAQLTNTPAGQPIALASHVPILGAGLFYFRKEVVKEYQFNLPGALMHQDFRRITDLLYRFPQVKVCLSGHSHLLDRVDYNNITYLGNGAVSGSWWNGAVEQTEPGYGLVTLYQDGGFEREYVRYGA